MPAAMAAAPEGWAVSAEGAGTGQEELGSEATHGLKPRVQPGTLVWPQSPELPISALASASGRSSPMGADSGGPHPSPAVLGEHLGPPPRPRRLQWGPAGVREASPSPRCGNSIWAKLSPSWTLNTLKTFSGDFSGDFC